MNFDKQKIKALSEILTFEEPCISIYLPTYRAGQVQEDKIRFKNALTKAADKLTEGKIFLQKQFDKKAAQKLLSPAYDLLENDEFWLHLSDGLALFIGKNIFEHFELPIKFNPLVHVGKSFYLRQLMPMFTGENRFFLLALSQGEVRFFEVLKHHITPVIIKDLVPENIDITLEKEENASFQSHSAGTDAAIFHGQGGGKDQKIEDLKKYFRKIDDGLMQMLHDENAPMIIAAVDYLIPVYREITRYPKLMDIHLSGNPENDDPVLLHEKALAMMAPFFNSEKQGKKKQFTQYLHENKASTSLSEIVQAAQEGRIDTLFVDKNAPLAWGFHRHLTDHSVEMYEEQNEHNSCLLNYAAMHTWRNGGRVYNIPREDLPQQQSSVNAIFRF